MTLPADAWQRGLGPLWRRFWDTYPPPTWSPSMERTTRRWRAS